MSQVSNSESSKAKRNKKQNLSKEDVPELTKEESKIAKFLRLSCPNRQGNLMGMKVDFFVGNKLVDCLMESKWGPGLTQEQQTARKDKQQYLASRQACISFMQRLMNKQLFYRAVKIYKEQSDNSKDSNETPNLRKRKSQNQNKENTNTPEKAGSGDASTPTPSQKDQNQSKKKFKLEMHEDQKFVDSNEPYVWFYDPTSTKTYIIGSLLILGAIGICLFPLWPSQVREGVYYLSLAGASFLGAILGLIVLKYILFGIVWGITFGKVTLWIFPNLTEDVGFFESFVPVYKCIIGSGSSSSTEKESKDKNNETKESKNDTETSKNDQNKSGTNTTTNELSKSTLDINTVSSSSGTPRVTKSTNSNKDTNKDDVEDFELVDDDDLVKVKKSNEDDESDS